MGSLPPETFIVFALAAFVVAGVLLFWAVRYINKGNRGSAEPDENTLSAPNETSANVTSSTAAGEQELLRVSRTKKGELVIVVQGHRYRYLREIKDPQIGHDTVAAIKSVMAFAENWLPAAQPPPPSTQVEGREPVVDEKTFLEKLSQINLFAPGRPAAASLPQPLIPVDTINALVQKRLNKRPDLATQSVRLATGAGGSLRIYVGLQTFEAVADIPDPEIRSLIQNAIHEWENS